MISDVQTLADQQGLHGPAGSVASTPTIWRVLEGVANAPGMLGSIRLARAQARDRAWLARGELTGCELPGSRAAGRLLAQVVIDLDATLVTAVKKKTAPQSLVSGPVLPCAAAAQELRRPRGARAGVEVVPWQSTGCAAKGFADVANLRSSTLTVVVGMSPLTEDP